jgi:ribonuclease BN (tRNA processing enzyme)
MTKIQFLGTAPGIPTRDKKHSCIYVRADRFCCLLDCGEGASQSFITHFDDFEELDFILITHFHPDHSAGIYMFIQMLYLKKRQKKLTIYLPESIKQFRETLDLFYLFPQKLTFELELLFIEQIMDRYHTIEVFRNDHLLSNEDFLTEHKLQNRMNCYSLKFNLGSKIIAYTSDISSIECIRYFISECHICIIDAIHPPIAELIDLEQKVVEKIYLTHGMIYNLSQYIQNRVKYIVAEDGNVIKDRG